MDIEKTNKFLREAVELIAEEMGQEGKLGYRAKQGVGRMKGTTYPTKSRKKPGIYNR